MQKYRRVIKPRETVVMEEEEIRVTVAGNVSAYVSRAEKLLNEMGKEFVTVTATGSALTKAVTTAEIIKRHFKGLHQITKCLIRETEEEYEPLEEGLERVTETRQVACIEIKLSKGVLDKFDKGYQEPLDEALVKEGGSGDHVAVRGRGFGRGKGFGKGRGRGKGRGKNWGGGSWDGGQYHNTWQSGKSRGRGKGAKSWGKGESWKGAGSSWKGKGTGKGWDDWGKGKSGYHADTRAKGKGKHDWHGSTGKDGWKGRDDWHGHGGGDWKSHNKNWHDGRRDSWHEGKSDKWHEGKGKGDSWHREGKGKGWHDGKGKGKGKPEFGKGGWQEGFGGFGGFEPGFFPAPFPPPFGAFGGFGCGGKPFGW